VVIVSCVAVLLLVCLIERPPLREHSAFVLDGPFQGIQALSPRVTKAGFVDVDYVLVRTKHSHTHLMFAFTANAQRRSQRPVSLTVRAFDAQNRLVQTRAWFSDCSMELEPKTMQWGRDVLQYPANNQISADFREPVGRDIVRIEFDFVRL
jgi:hypothetical protein